MKGLRKDIKMVAIEDYLGNRSVHKTLQSFRQMYRLGTKPTKYLLCTTLAKTFNLRLDLQFHACVIHMGYIGNWILNSALVDLYPKCNAIMDVRRMFCGME